MLKVAVVLISHEIQANENMKLLNNIVKSRGNVNLVKFEGNELENKDNHKNHFHSDHNPK